MVKISVSFLHASEQMRKTPVFLIYERLPGNTPVLLPWTIHNGAPCLDHHQIGMGLIQYLINEHMSLKISIKTIGTQPIGEFPYFDYNTDTSYKYPMM